MRPDVHVVSDTDCEDVRAFGFVQPTRSQLNEATDGRSGEAELNLELSENLPR
jgi:hypothetical protein